MSIVTILDGGMGRELKRMGAPFKQPEWSALALMEAPDTVRQAHQAFIDAGAGVITTNAYAVVPFHIGQERFDARGLELIRLAAEIARDVADSADAEVKVAGSIPPLFGSYEPDNFKADLAPAIIKPLIEGQKDVVDFWLIETTSSLEEARFAYDRLKDTGKPIWISFTVNDRHEENVAVTNRAGESIEDCARALLDMGGVEAMLFNCSHPKEMADAVAAAYGVLGDAMPVGVYANTFKVPRLNKADNISTIDEDLTPDAYLEFARSWHAAGANLLGGCCGIGPDHIKALHDAF